MNPGIKRPLAMLLCLILAIFGYMSAAHGIQPVCTYIYRRTGNVYTGGSAIL